MPWKAKNPVDLRMEFVTRHKAGERISDLCREFDISRKTGHKIWNRYKEVGAEGLFDVSRAPRRIPHKTPNEIVDLVVQERGKHPTWGPRKLKVMLERSSGIALPSSSTIGGILKSRGLIEPRRRRPRATPRPNSQAGVCSPNVPHRHDSQRPRSHATPMRPAQCRRPVLDTLPRGCLDM